MLPQARSSRDVVIRTSESSRARTFYSQILGFTVVDESETLFRVDTGAIRLFIESGPSHGPVFDFLVADVQAMKAKLLAAGCALIEEDRSVPRCYMRDPFGLVFNLGLSASPD